MLIVRYCDNNVIKDLQVSVQNAHEVFRNKSRKFGRAELILVDAGVEYTLM